MKEKQPQPYEFSRIAQEMIGDLRHVPFNEPQKMRRRPTRDAAALMDELIGKFKIGQTSIEDAIRAAWPGMVGHANAQYSLPANIDAKNNLVVLYSHSMVHSNLSLLRPGLLLKIRELPNCGHIRDIKFRLGS